MRERGQAGRHENRGGGGRREVGCIILSGVRGRHSTFYWQRVLCVIRNLTINQKAAVAFPAFPTKFSQFSCGKATAGGGREE